jgi:Ecdysteroid kinase-like family
MPESIQEAFFRHNLRVFKDMLGQNTWPKLNKETFIEKIDEVMMKCTARGQKVFSPSSGYNVLNHGDFFLRNLLFQEVDGKAREMKFVRMNERK